MLVEFLEKLEKLGYAQESVATGFQDLEIDVNESRIRSIPSDPNEINITRTYKRPHALFSKTDTYEFFALQQYDDRSFQIRYWMEDKYDRGPVTRGLFDKDGYPVNSDAWEIAEELGFVVPKPEEVVERLAPIYEEFNKLGRSLTIPGEGATTRVDQGERTYGDWYGKNGGWSDAFWENVDRGLLVQYTEATDYNALYLSAFDMRHEDGRRLKTLFEIGRERLPTGKDFYRFHPREAFYVEGELIKTGEINDFVWVILAAKD